MESCPYIHGQTPTAVYPSPLPPPSLIPKLIPCCRIGESPSSPFPALPDGSVWIERRHTKEKKGNKEQECNRALLSFQTRTWLSVIFKFWKRLSFCLLEFRNVSKSCHVFPHGFINQCITTDGAAWTTHSGTVKDLLVYIFLRLMLIPSDTFLRLSASVQGLVLKRMAAITV